jgi:hypothetical protein
MRFNKNTHLCKLNDQPAVFNRINIICGENGSKFIQINNKHLLNSEKNLQYARIFGILSYVSAPIILFADPRYFVFTILFGFASINYYEEADTSITYYIDDIKKDI